MLLRLLRQLGRDCLRGDTSKGVSNRMGKKEITKAGAPDHPAALEDGDQISDLERVRFIMRLRGLMKEDKKVSSVDQCCPVRTRRTKGFCPRSGILPPLFTKVAGHSLEVFVCV